jgi:hypothetical protein
MLTAILLQAQRFVPLHVEAAEHRRECSCDACAHRAVASEPYPWCVFCTSSEDVHREARALTFVGRPYLGRTAQPYAALCQSCWCKTRAA